MVSKLYNGSAWKNVNGLKLYNGSVWKNATKGWVWNGSAWKQWYPEYPLNTAQPTVSGSTTQGSTLSVTNGSWNSNLAYAPISYTYQWLRAGVNISGATGSTYATVVADVGNAISCRVTASNNRGTTPSTSSNSITVITATYTISYAGNGNTGGSAPTSPTSVSNGSTFVTPTNTYTRTGYTFSSWLSSQNSTTYAAGATHPAVTGNLTLTAQWTANTQTISYAGNGNTGGSAPTSPTTVSYGSTFVTPSNTYSRTGYTFSGWLSSQNSNVYSAGTTHPAATGNITLTAQWTANTQTISYAGNGNTGGSAPTSPTTVSYGSTFTVPSNTYTRTGYTFSSWLSSQNSTTYTAGTTHPAATGNITLTAQWTANTLTVTWDSQGGSAISSTTTTTGGTVSNPGSPTRSGYTFNGWFAASSGGTAISFPYSHGQTASFTLYAQWTQNNLTAPTISSVVSAGPGGSVTVNFTGGSGPFYQMWWQGSSDFTNVQSWDSNSNSSPLIDATGPTSAGTYYVGIRSASVQDGYGAGPSTDFSSWTVTSFTVADPAPSSAPTGIIATRYTAGTCNYTSIGWNAVSGATSYDVYRTTNSATTTPPASPGWAAPPGNANGVTGVTTAAWDYGSSTSAFYWVRAVNAAGAGPWSSKITPTTSSAAC